MSTMVEFDLSTVITHVSCSKSPFPLRKSVANHSHAFKIMTSILANQNEVMSLYSTPVTLLKVELAGSGGCDVMSFSMAEI